jgi:hypothetical protein
VAGVVPEDAGDTGSRSGADEYRFRRRESSTRRLTRRRARHANGVSVRRVPLRALAVVVGVSCVLLGLAAPGDAQQAVASVTVAATQQGTIAVAGCSMDFVPSVVSPPTFVLTRTGDASAPLTVSLGWSDAGSGVTVSPTSATFPAGSSTVTVTGTFSALPTLYSVTLTVLTAAGYQPGSPSSATTDLVRVTPSCAVQPPVTAPPPFTG